MAQPRVRVCVRCGMVGRFARPRRWQKVCDGCLADPSSKARYTSDAKVRWARARRRAIERLIEQHRDEFEALFAEERERLGDGWPGATLREIDDYERRRIEAAEAGWQPH